MKILYVAPKVPYPVQDGGCFAMMQLIRSLKDCGVTLTGLFLATHKHPWTADSEKELLEYFDSCKVVQIDTNIRLFGAFSSFLRKRNYNLERFRNDEVKAALSSLTKKDFDLVLFDGLFAGACLTDWSLPKQLTSVMRTHNVEHEIWRGLAREQRNGLKKQYLGQLASSLCREEKRILSGVDEIWSMTNDDHRTFLRMGIKIPIRTIPVVVTKVETEPDLSVNTAFFLGSMDWLPNQDAVRYLIEEIWKTTANLPQLKIAGSKAEKLQLPETVQNCGRVPDVLDFMQHAGFMVAPIFSGSGVRIKLLEALAAGVPCITTTIGAQGISVQDSGVLIADSVQAFIQHIHVLSESTALREELSRKGRTYIQNYHSFEVVNALIAKRFVE
jgi:glycosyltransferase involved in cell wall biosynthesis